MKLRAELAESKRETSEFLERVEQAQQKKKAAVRQMRARLHARACRAAPLTRACCEQKRKAIAAGSGTKRRRTAAE